MSIGSVLKTLGVVAAVAFMGADKDKRDSERKPSQGTPPKPERPGTSSMFIEERARLDAYFAEHGSKPLAECKEDILDLMNECIGKAYQEGGSEMEAGIRRNNPHVRWE